ncbi:N-formylglutamate amidohydrolase [Marilutibacter alkalisoli]|uniref:N-formylglutamate amidohydrolase n=1 Tax=Marilutibacter alkalisoli TaxID=2591633 RepID=A0A514BVA6_9GAMM|nr:N-formylglutamate amidohydrolase [Lysobacter alkalisoli]QDH70969.1 N-formylglutamate amidohydrolase [Lysobacter alkalisoli]
MDDKAPATSSFFGLDERLVLQRPSADWDLVLDEGPVVATAIHDGHLMRPSLIPHLAIDEDQRRREEDPMTGVLVSVGDVRLCVRASRFQVDLNRPRERALSTNPEDTWGIRVWKGPLPEQELALSLALHDRFYAMVTELVEHLIARWGCVLVLDIHSYNHRRAGADAQPAMAGGNPDIDVGATTLDRSRWGAVVEYMIEVLGEHPAGGRRLDVRENVRYPDGGHFPEWLYATYGDRVCAITLEYKKIYMDEWEGHADIEVIEDLRKGLQAAVDGVRPEFTACR